MSPIARHWNWCVTSRRWSRTPDSRVSGLFVLTFREDEALPEPLAELVSHVPGRTLPLSGLDLEGIRAFLNRQDIAQKLLEVTGGNPRRAR